MLGHWASGSGEAGGGHWLMQGRGGGGRVQPGQWAVSRGEGGQDQHGTVWPGKQCSLETKQPRLSR